MLRSQARRAAQSVPVMIMEELTTTTASAAANGNHENVAPFIT